MAKRILIIGVMAAFAVSAVAVAQKRNAVEEARFGSVKVNRMESSIGCPTGTLVIPWHVNYQGYLTDDAANPIDDTLSMTFSIFTDSIGGTELWYETQDVIVEDGIFNEILGQLTPIPSDVFGADESRWLELEVETQALSPRTEITSVGYAYRALKADTGDYAVDADMLDGHDWGDLYPNADMVDGYHYSPSWEPDGYLSGEPAGGDLAGIYPDPTVDRLQNRPVSSAAPDTGQVLKWSGSQWAPAQDQSGGEQDLAQTLAIGNSAGSYSIDMSGQRIESLGDPNSGDDAIDRNYADVRYYNVGETVGNADQVDGEHAMQHASATGAPHARAAKNCEKWANHNWGDSYPVADYANNANKWDGHDWGVNYPVADYASNADRWDGHNWGEPYPNTDSVNSIGASTTRSPNHLYPLDNQGRLTLDFSSGLVEDAAIGWAVYASIPIGVAATYAVQAVNSYITGIGVRGAGSKAGVIGKSTSSDKTGVIGVGNNLSTYSVLTDGSGVAGTGDRVGVFGKASGSSGTREGGYFSSAGGGWAYVGASIGGTDYKIYGSGNVSTVMQTRAGKKVLFAPESPEAWFEDFGHARLKSGFVHVDLDPLFLDCVTINGQYPMKVFVQLNDDCEGVYVKTANTGFDALELRGGESNAAFTYRVLAKRKGNEPLRFPEAIEEREIVEADKE